MSSMLTLSVQRPIQNVSDSTLSPVPTSTSTSPCVTPQPQTPVVCSNVTLVRNGRKRPALNLPPLQLQSAIEHRRQVNDPRNRDISAQIEASFALAAPSSPGGYSTSSESQPSGSDDDSQQLYGKGEKRTRLDSTTPSIYSTESVESLDLDGASSSKTSGVYDIPATLGADEYLVITHGDDFQVLENKTGVLFQATKLDAPKYKHFMKVATRIESAKKFFEPAEFRRLKSRIIPDDTRIVYGSRGISYLLMPANHSSLNLKVKDPKKPRDRARLPEKDVQSLVYQLVEIMEICHSVGIFFGDFKFDKFVFTDPEMTQIRVRSPLIFHLSNDVKCGTLFNTKVGWAFMAPEMLNRRQTSYGGVAADMWALGVLAFTLLVGNYPFVATEPQTLFARIRSRCVTAKIEHFASVEGRIMVYSLLCKNPSDRPSAHRLKQCHWLRMSAEELCSSSSQTPSFDCGAAFRQHLQMQFFHNQQQQLLHQPPQQPQQPSRGLLPRVSSDRRLNQRVMEQRLAMYRVQSDQVVPAGIPIPPVPATANVLFPTSSRICFNLEARR